MHELSAPDDLVGRTEGRAGLRDHPVAVVAGVGGYLPPTVVTNADLCQRFDTSEEWIHSRTGILTRHVVGANQATSDLAVEAGARALSSAARATGDGTVDLVILATTTPDHTCPATAPAVATRLGLIGVPAFDVGAVCSGFVYGLAVAGGLLAGGAYSRVLLIAADTFTTILNPEDRSTAAIFGDGAGAVVLHAGSTDKAGAVQGIDLGSDGELADLISVRAGGSRHPDRQAVTDEADLWFSMQGQAVYRHAIRRMTGTARNALDRAGWKPEEVDWLVPHQANARILGAVAADLGLPSERVYSNVTTVGNTAAASIPLALAEAAEEGKLAAGQRILLSAFGGGATWGAVALTWPELPIPAGIHSDERSQQLFAKK